MRGPASGDLSPDEAALWERFTSQRDPAARACLIERHLPVAHKMAAMLYAARADNSVEFDDYLQYARIGLLEAIDRYDPAREAGFATFASYRVRGAILNGISQSTELATQRAERHRLRREQLKSIGDETSTTDEGFTRMVDLTLSLAIGYLLEESGISESGQADRGSDPYQSFEIKRLRERMAELLTALPERERSIIRHHYFEHREFVVIAGMLEISKGRVAQLHARALQRLRDGYRESESVDKRV